MGKKITLAPRDESAAPDAEKVNAYLEARDDVQRLDADAFLLEISSSDIATQLEVYTGHEGEPIHYVRIEMETGGIPYTSALGTEVRKLCEELARRFDLVAVVGRERKEIGELFDAGF